MRNNYEKLKNFLISRLLKTSKHYHCSRRIFGFSKRLPNGNLYKKFTGIGATRGEIIAGRNCILVFPTIDLAKVKYLKACEEVF